MKWTHRGTIAAACAAAAGPAVTGPDFEHRPWIPLLGAGGASPFSTNVAVRRRRDKQTEGRRVAAVREEIKPREMVRECRNKPGRDAGRAPVTMWRLAYFCRLRALCRRRWCGRVRSRRRASSPGLNRFGANVSGALGDHPRTGEPPVPFCLPGASRTAIAPAGGPGDWRGIAGNPDLAGERAACARLRRAGLKESGICCAREHRRAPLAAARSPRRAPARHRGRPPYAGPVGGSVRRNDSGPCGTNAERVASGTGVACRPNFGGAGAAPGPAVRQTLTYGVAADKAGADLAPMAYRDAMDYGGDPGKINQIMRGAADDWGPAGFAEAALKTGPDEHAPSSTPRRTRRSWPTGAASRNYAWATGIWRHVAPWRPGTCRWASSTARCPTRTAGRCRSRRAGGFLIFFIARRPPAGRHIQSAARVRHAPGDRPAGAYGPPRAASCMAGSDPDIVRARAASAGAGDGRSFRYIPYAPGSPNA